MRSGAPSGACDPGQEGAVSCPLFPGPAPSPAPLSLGRGWLRAEVLACTLHFVPDLVILSVSLMPVLP